MKRDMNLVREILLAVEAREHGMGAAELNIEGHSQEEIGYHVYLMGKAGLLVAVEITHLGSPSPEALASGLTWQGHDFLDAARDPSLWQKALDKIRTTGSALTIEIVKAVLVQLTRQQLGL